MRRWLAVVVALALCLAAGARADAPRRVALIIANADYLNAAPLKNPPNDAALMEDALKKAGFQVIDTQADLGIGAFRDALRRFSAQAAGADAAVIYYAGHGIEAENTNWLLPKDVTLQTPRDLDYEAINVELVLRATEGARLRMVVLDACRDNPFAKGQSWTSEMRAAQGGLGELKVDDVVVIYSAAAGEKAIDGSGANSPFAKALAKRLPEPGLEIHLLGSKVRDDVLRMTGGRQRPYVSASISGDPFVFVQVNITPPAPAPPVPSSPSPPAVNFSVGDLASWEAWQKGMQAAFDVAAAFQGGADIRRAAWDRFLADYHDKNPYSNEDDRLRTEAARRKAAIVDTPLALAAPTPAAAAPLPSAETARPVGEGEVFRDCADVCPAMVKIPPGAFDMGSRDSEPSRAPNEGPVHRVTIGYAFAVSEYPITVGEFARFVEDARYDAGNRCFTSQRGASFIGDSALARVSKFLSDHNWHNVGFEQVETSPVVCVSWNDALAYAAWLSRKTGKAYRLLSEAEYEYINRAGASTVYWWGDDPEKVCANANSADLDLEPYAAAGRNYSECHDGFAFTSPVGSFKPNAFGLFDTTGNAWSWVADCFRDSYAGAPTDGSVATGGDCNARRLRGGSWDDESVSLRLAQRYGELAADRYDIIGFRVARTL